MKKEKERSSNMKLSLLITAFALTLNASQQGLQLMLAQSPIPSVFLNEKLWTSGIITVLAFFLMWQQWIEKNILRTETQSRESRMADQISKLQEQHSADLVTVSDAVNTIKSLEKEIIDLSAKMDNNCAKCDARRNEFSGMISQITAQTQKK